MLEGDARQDRQVGGGTERIHPSAFDYDIGGNAQFTRVLCRQPQVVRAEAGQRG
ncbi:MAG: hypothetical protein NT169_02375 [Chloroflexi bacterium]|nr:hypothetical protein [Chloroflexota bacterium]